MASKEEKREEEELKGYSDGLLQNLLKSFPSHLFPPLFRSEELFLLYRYRLCHITKSSVESGGS